MSENISILEGGKAENFGQVTKLRTDDGNGGHDLWVPKSDVATGHLSVKKNGLYYSNQYTPTSAEKKDKDSHGYNVYGFDTISVSIKKKVTGKKKVGGKDVPTMVEVDDDDNIVETSIPDNIRVTTLPDKMTYHNGDMMNYSGMIVKMYAGNNLFTDAQHPDGVLSHPELDLPVTTVGGDIKGTIDGNNIDSDGFTDVLISFYTMDMSKTVGNLTVGYDGQFYAIYNGITITRTGYDTSQIYEPRQFRWRVDDNGGVHFYIQFPEAAQTPAGDMTGALDTEALGMDVNLSGGSTEIPVSWISTYDDEKLKDKFNITIVQ